jgi:acetate kinase
MGHKATACRGLTGGFQKDEPLNVLAFNSGSSTLKFKVMGVRENTALGQQEVLAHGLVERIGERAKAKFTALGEEQLRETLDLDDHGTATREVILWLESLGLVRENGIGAVGHRIVHGGQRFHEPTPLSDEVIEAIEALRYLAPLHNEPSLKAIRAAQGLLGRDMPMVAVFDTAFHRFMPERAATYGLPLELAKKHGIRRYGFHGLAHRYMTEKYALLLGVPLEHVRIITLQLGNGCSATAVSGGRSVDTSMGFTPLEGLMMGSRSGDLDPHIPGFLSLRESVAVEEVERWLNTQSGLLGVSGLSKDLRDLLEAERLGDEKAALALELFCYRVRKQIGAYLAVLGGAEALVFGGGIGENSPEIRGRISAGMEWCGLVLDETRNASVRGSEGRISQDSARIQVYVIPVDEEVMVARDTVLCLGRMRGR